MPAVKGRRAVTKGNGFTEKRELIEFRLDQNEAQIKALDASITYRFNALDGKFDEFGQTLAKHKVFVAIITALASVLASTLVATLIERAVHSTIH